MSFHNHLGLVFVLGFTGLIVPAHAQTDAAPKFEKHGRKYKAPPETSHIEVTVLKGFNKKPIMNAAVIFHPIKDGVDSGTLEVKSDPEGKATIDVIPMGSQVRIQVIANGFATYAEDYTINEATREILVNMVRPQAQISTYVDNEGKPAPVNPGVQEPIRPKKTAPTAKPPTAPTQPSQLSTTPSPAPQQ